MKRAFLAALCAAASAFELPLEHAFGVSAPFEFRGTVLEVTPTNPKSKVVRALPDTLRLEGGNATAMASLLAGDGFYRVRARSAFRTAPDALLRLMKCSRSV